jgi:hypothetical protein
MSAEHWARRLIAAKNGMCWAWTQYCNANGTSKQGSKFRKFNAARRWYQKVYKIYSAKMNPPDPTPDPDMPQPRSSASWPVESEMFKLQRKNETTRAALLLAEREISRLRKEFGHCIDEAWNGRINAIVSACKKIQDEA